ncbi:MAG: hypothetical protein FWE35_27680 [Streptosporangiales bacterium]|jgi:hypothetical protein|nr:hypothetical protein [Streptosporangiales bacterium]
MYELAAGIVRRVMNLLGSSQSALGAFLRFLTTVHLAVYRVTGGRVTGTKVMPVVILSPAPVRVPAGPYEDASPVGR